MTEEEWLSCGDPAVMLEFLRDKASDRKLRLLACAGAINRFGHDAGVQRAVGVAEQWADGHGLGDVSDLSDYYVLFYSAWQAADEGTVASLDLCANTPEKRTLRRLLTVAFRCLFGVLPFRPVAFDPAWRSEAVVGIARGIYEDRAFERMPILADALQEAGCEHPDVLTHCREPGTHVRGCWVVDLVLGKE